MLETKATEQHNDRTTELSGTQLQSEAPSGGNKSEPDMRALMVGMEWLPNETGGLNRYFYDEVHALPAVGIGGVALVSALMPGQNAPLRLEAMAAPGAGLAACWRGARRVARRELERGVDVVNPHFALYAWPWMRDLPADMPVVVNFQGPWSAEIVEEGTRRLRRFRALLAKRIERSVYSRANRIITLSHAFKIEVQQRYDIPPERVRVVPGGVEMRPFLAAPDRRQARERLGWPQDVPIFLSIRRLTTRMGLENCVQAFGELRRAHPQALLFIGGKGHLKEALERQIVTLGLADSVRLLGFLPDEKLPLAYAAATATLVPTIALEGFGLVTLESLASGTPVLGTPVGGTPEILRGLAADLVFESPLPDAMAQRLDAVLSGRMALPDSRACREYAARYAWPQIAPRIRALYDEVMPGYQPPRPVSDTSASNNSVSDTNAPAQQVTTMR